VEEVHHLLERGALRQVLDPEAHVPQPSGLAVHVGEPGGGGDDFLETLVGHPRLPSRRYLEVEMVRSDSTSVPPSGGRGAVRATGG
jgi:hypothetical protein